MSELRIDQEFAALCPPLTPEEAALLEASLKAEGCRDPIVVWTGHKDTILDGHNRYRICRANGIKFKTTAMEFATRAEASNWVISNALGRRNLTDAQKAYLRGKRYDAEKQIAAGAPKGNRNNRPESQRRQNGAIDSQHGRTRNKVAADTGVSPNTIERNAEFAKAVDSLVEQGGADVRGKILSGQVKLREKDVDAINEMKPKELAAVAAVIAKGEKPDIGATTSTETNGERKLKGVGIIRANEAINCLTRIPKNDALRERGFQLVTDWIRHNK